MKTMVEQARSLAPDNEVDAAIARVLQAERAAEEHVEQARAEALDIAEAARRAVRDLEARTERRMRAIRAAFAAATARDLEALAQATVQARARSVLCPADVNRVDAAVAQLAASLTRGAG